MRTFGLSACNAAGRIGGFLAPYATVSGLAGSMLCSTEVQQQIGGSLAQDATVVWQRYVQHPEPQARARTAQASCQ